MNDVELIAPTKAMLEEANPYSLVNMVEGEAFSKAVSRIPADLLKMSETELREMVKPTRTDYAIRTALWNEFRLAHDTKQKINVQRVFGGICTYNNWYYYILNVPAKLAWLLQPLQEFEKGLEPLLARVVDRYDELINLDIYDEKGKPVPALAKIVLEAAKMIEYRLKGATIQRVESKNLNITGQIHQAGPGAEKTMEQLTKRLAELNKENRRAMNGGSSPAAYTHDVVPFSD